MKIRFLIPVLLCSFPLGLKAQNNSFNDTIRINEIVVKAKVNENVNSAYRKLTVDSAALSQKRLFSLSDIINESVPLFIKSYGPGTLASVSLRGTGAVHTQVSWNGISLNSPMLGQSDLSLVPAVFIDDITVDFGSSSMFKTTGAFGGLININTKPDWKNGFRSSFDGGTGSFGLWSGSLKAEMGNTGFQSVTRASFRMAENNFKYLNNVSYSNPVYERRNNAGYAQESFMQELFFKGTNSTSSASVWAQSSLRNIPSNILVTDENSGGYQRDEHVRALFSHSKYKNRTTIDLNSGIFYEKLSYINNQASINSVNHSSTFVGKGEWETNLPGYIKLKFIASEELNLVNSVNYNNRKIRNIITTTGIFRKKIFNTAAITLLLKENITDKYVLSPDYTAGIDFNEAKNSRFWIKSNISKNSRIPTMNDIYWNPGGNPNIRNEYCFSEELILGTHPRLTREIDMTFELSAYSGKIRDMIQWLPGESGIWTPENIQSVNIRGIETDYNLKISSDVLNCSVSGYYTLNYSVYHSGPEDIQGKQLIYIPKHQAGGLLRTSYSVFFASFGYNYTGKRFITTNNEKYLNGYFKCNSELGINLFQKGKNRLLLKIMIENLFNENYEVMAYYPMPGRWFLFSLNYQYGR